MPPLEELAAWTGLFYWNPGSDPPFSDDVARLVAPTGSPSIDPRRVAMLDAHTSVCTAMLEPGGYPRHVAFDGMGRVGVIANEAGWVHLVR